MIINVLTEKTNNLIRKSMSDNTPEIEKEPETLLWLTRTAANPSGTMGLLESHINSLCLCTHEGRIPSDRRSYVSWLLEPRKYRAYVDKCTCQYRGVNVPGYWLFFDRVPNFPKACITADERAINKYGIIKIGDGSVNDYQLERYDEACRTFIRWCKTVYDTRGTEPFCIDIIQPEHAMRFSDLNELEFKEQELQEELERHRQSLIAELYG